MAVVLTLAGTRAEAQPQRVHASGDVVLFYGSYYKRRPRTVDASKINNGYGTPTFEETVYRARNLHWTGWGTSKAVGRGRITFCVIDYTPCRTRRGTVTLITIWRNGCGDASLPSYRWVRWNFPGHRSKRVVAMPEC